MLVVVESLNKPMYMARVMQDSRQITRFGMYMDGLRNAFIRFRRGISILLLKLSGSSCRN